MDAKFPQWLKDRMVFAGPTGDKSDPPKLKRVIPQNNSCEDCPRTLDDIRTVDIKFNHSRGGWWSEKCTVCGNFKHPITEKFEVENKVKLGAIFDRYNLRKDK